MIIKRDKWSKNFAEWFQDILDRTGLVDFRYPVKGVGVWLPYGFKLRKFTMDILRKLLDESGHEEVLFPMMISQSMIGKESEHIRSFEEQVLWITHAGTNELDEKLALRPTSETAIAPMLKLWIRSHADLPKRLYQIVSIFRHETKATKPLIRVREVTTFKEAHTSHETFEEAERQVNDATRIYSNFFTSLALPYLISKRPQWDKFAGALYSIAFDTIFPDGKTLQIGTVHNLGQSFSKPFEITFEKRDGSRDYIWQTCYGISERIIAAIIAIHGDDRGLVLPPIVAPIQVIIIPIFYKHLEEKIVNACRKIKEILEERNIRVEIDSRSKMTPGSKFFEWELKGVPLRIEVGPKDIEHNKAMLVRRDTLERILVTQNNIHADVPRILSDIQEYLKVRAMEKIRSDIKKVRNLDDIGNLLGKTTVIELEWCGSDQCGRVLEEKTGLTVLGASLDNFKPVGKCVLCGRNATSIIRLAKSY